jgi:CheY-like chemotaxis protein
MNEKIPQPILVVENPRVVGISLCQAIRQTGISHSCLQLPDAASVELYLQGTGKYSDRREFPMPGLVLMDVTLPGLGQAEPLPWLKSQTFRQIVVKRVSGPLDPGHFESAVAFGQNSLLCKLPDSESLDAFVKALIASGEPVEETSEIVA